jgi:hypothetical protein
VAIETVRRQVLTSCLPLVVCALAGCKSGALDLAGRTEEEPPRPALAARIHVADPQTSSQLVSGWYKVEQNAWRWTARKFTVVVRPPVGAARRGAILRFNFTLPDLLVSQLKAVTLSAAVQGTELAPETYRKPGDCVYVREVPPGVFSDRAVRIDFALNRALLPRNTEKRELGVVARYLGLEETE